MTQDTAHMPLDERGLEAAYSAGRDYVMEMDDRTKQMLRVSIRAYLQTAAADVNGLVDEWRKAMDGVTPGPWETTGEGVTDSGREWPGSLSMEFIPNGHDDDINTRREADAGWMARCSPDRIDGLLATLQTLSASNAALEAENGRLREALTEVGQFLDGEPEYHTQGMGCGLEDRYITNRYDAMSYGWECAMERVYSEHINHAKDTIARAALSAPKGGQDHG